MKCPLKFDIPEEFVKKHPGGISNIRGIDSHVEPLCLFFCAHMHRPLKLPLDKLAMYSSIERQDLEPSPLVQAINYAFLESSKEAKDKPYYFWMYNAVIFFVDMFLLPLTTIAYIFWPFYWWPSAIVFGGCGIHFAFSNFHIRHHTGKLTPFGGFNEKRVFPGWFLYILNTYFCFWDNLLMVEPVAWRAQHNFSHHILTNTADDYDIWSPYPLLRLVSWQTRRSWHNLQFLYVVLVLSVNGLFFPILNFARRPSVMTGSSGVVYYIMLIILPYTFQEASLFEVVIRYFVAIMLASLLITLIFQVSHNSNELKPYPKVPSLGGEVTISSKRDDQRECMVEGPWVPDFNPSGVKQEPNPIIMEIESGSGQITKQIDAWYKMQFDNSIDWGSWLACCFLGAINIQLVHHLAFAAHPVECHLVHRRLLSAKKTGRLPLPPTDSVMPTSTVPMPHYVYVPTFSEVVRGYLNYLLTLSK